MAAFPGRGAGRLCGAGWLRGARGPGRASARDGGGGWCGVRPAPVSAGLSLELRDPHRLFKPTLVPAAPARPRSPVASRVSPPRHRALSLVCARHRERGLPVFTWPVPRLRRSPPTCPGTAGAGLGGERPPVRAGAGRSHVPVRRGWRHRQRPASRSRLLPRTPRCGSRAGGSGPPSASHRMVLMPAVCFGF